MIKNSTIYLQLEVPQHWFTSFTCVFLKEVVATNFHSHGVSDYEKTLNENTDIWVDVGEGG